MGGIIYPQLPRYREPGDQDRRIEMENNGCYERFPWWIAIVSNLVSLAIYASGAFIIYRVGWIWMAVYLCLILVLEIRLLKGSCAICCYYGKVCAFGKGRLSSLFFKQGDPERFASRKVTWWELVPDILVSLIPVVVGIVILVRDFSRAVLAAVLLLFLLTSAGNGFVRSTLACRHCRQREIGCPAERLFRKTQPRQD
jgi:hypothetical protein